MAITKASLPAKKRILAVCVRLFLEQGYKKTTVAEIVTKAGGVKQQLSEYISSQGRSAYRACEVYVREPV